MDRWIVEPIKDSTGVNLVNLDTDQLIYVDGPVFMDTLVDLCTPVKR